MPVAATTSGIVQPSSNNSFGVCMFFLLKNFRKLSLQSFWGFPINCLRQLLKTSELALTKPIQGNGEFSHAGSTYGNREERFKKLQVIQRLNEFPQLCCVKTAAPTKEVAHLRC